MKRFVTMICTVLAVLTMFIAHTGAGLASYFGWYQPKVPDRLVK